MGTITENKLAIYQSADGSLQLDVKLDNETVWLSQQQMVELFDSTKQNISLHIKNILSEGELEESTVKDFLTVRKECNRMVTRSISYYNLDMIISVGYRVKSQRGIEFRRWANNVLKEYIIKGVARNDSRLEQLGQVVKLLKRVHESIALSSRPEFGSN